MISFLVGWDEYYYYANKSMALVYIEYSDSTKEEVLMLELREVPKDLLMRTNQRNKVDSFRGQPKEKNT